MAAEREGIANANADAVPVIHVVSDSVGQTAQAVARAAAAQFGVTEPVLRVLPKVKRFEEIRDFLEACMSERRLETGSDRILVLYTLVDGQLRGRLAAFVEARPSIVAVDLMTGVIDAIADMTGLQPSFKPGALHAADQHYFRRIEAIEFTIDHDDGRQPEGLTEADIVLLGVSRTGKTPLSIFLSQQGYKVANVPLDMQTEPPRQIFDVDKTRLFGLMTTPDVLVGVRRRRLGNAIAAAGSYADPEYVHEDLESARALMRRLGCIVVSTSHKAVEETAQEILSYYDRLHP